MGFDELATFYKTIRIGRTNLSMDSAEPGEMRWTGADFEGFTLDREWQSMTKTFEVTNASGNFRQIPYWVAIEGESDAMYGAGGFEWYNEASTVLLSHPTQSRDLTLAWMRGVPYPFNSTHMYDATISLKGQALELDSQGAMAIRASTTAALSGGLGVLVESRGAELMLHGESVSLNATHGVRLTAEGRDFVAAVLDTGRVIRLETVPGDATSHVEVVEGLLKSGGGKGLQLTGRTSVGLRAEAGPVAVEASTSASVEAAGGALTLTASTSTTATASSGDFTVATSAGGTKIALQTAELMFRASASHFYVCADQ